MPQSYIAESIRALPQLTVSDAVEEARSVVPEKTLMVTV
jgi:hypothetical protein